ncbi:hypothetical protein ACLF30_000213 [Cronobacter sakazakii]|uniref:hypothetical protein n=1 Tax=Cronobacter sakazakii TaxID=28141 RepID=UPI00195501DF|nr:hypothetical protein [Cronobacter sakazakii]ELL7784629.1 hypothetical protein [Cronobacter sakazakii]ELY2754050.1 hypothetical protein [Cronobacter sakazakii]ELY3763493.1 hypothetical protein [Cronobacter sakazakii]ELY4054681.1 hypothetical protein [Cronobacter sakazakii]ELY4459735.1 hypothetical protein [Cronobacter sakazakii]
MITISNEQAKDLRNAFKCWQQDYDPVEDKEQYDMFGLGVVAMDELLALRKERERAEPAYYLNQIDYGDGESFELRAYFRELDAMKSKDDFGGVVIPAYTAPPATDKVAETAVCPKCGNTGLADSGGVQPWGEPILIECDCTAPPAPGADDDSLPYDPQIAEYEQMMEAEQAQADTTSQQFESRAGKAVVPEGWKLVPVELTKEMRGKIHPFAEATCLDCGRQVVADCEDNVTASWNDMLAAAPAPVGKQSSTAEGNDDGFECTPVADLYELLTKCGECYDYTTSAKVAADWINYGYSAREYVKLERLQEALLFAAPEPCK